VVKSVPRKDVVI